MRATDLLVLPTGIVLRPAETVEGQLRDRLKHEPGDFVLSRPGSRSRSLLVDAAAATLLSKFHEPRTLADALLEVGRDTGSDPERLLDEVLPLVGHLCQHRLLVVAGSADAREIEPTLAPSSMFDDVRVLECVHLFEDVEVYHVVDRSGHHRALKILRPGCDPPVVEALDHEVAVLERLDGMHAPRVLARGEAGGQPFVMTSWCWGRDAGTVAEALRGATSASGAGGVAELCVRVLRAYGRLHDASVLHGDVHPANVRIGPDGSVTILDFGLSSCSAGDPALFPLGRGGIAEYVEPEFCEALVHGDPSPPVTALSEQYALGAMCFLLLTGVHYLQFDLQHDAWRSQVIEAPPRSFFACGVRSWPPVEQVLAQALDKDPAARFAGVSEFADQLERASRATFRRSREPTTRHEFLEQVVRNLRPNRDGVPSRGLREPTSTVNHGAAGIAYFFYRLAGMRDDPVYVAAADLWSSWARVQAEGRDAETTHEMGPTSGSAPASLFRGRAGVECVDALIRHTAGDRHAARGAARRFVAACAEGSGGTDVVVGQAGLLLGCAALMEALPAGRLADADLVVRDEIARVGDHLAQAIHRPGPPTGTPARAGGLGFAHGRAGVAFAGLRWGEATGCRPPWLREELDDLAELARRAGPAPATLTDDGGHSAQRASWCRGAAGRALLWNLADRCFPEASFGSLADAAATAIWRDRDIASASATLCCGYAGQAYALLATFRRTRDHRWLVRAELLTERAVALVAMSRPQGGLYKGAVGVALLAADIAQPEGSAMPLLETEHWRPG